jgi:hypothetical protein
MVRQFVGIFITMFSKMQMKKFVFICDGLKFAFMHKACHVFSLKKTRKILAPDFVFENVCDKNIFVSYNISLCHVGHKMKDFFKFKIML